MYNTDLPDKPELPSATKLLRSTLIALVVAIGILVTVIMPAEYGIDPTGLGRAMGLTQMGEVKMALAKEAAEEEALLAELEASQTEEAEPAAAPEPIAETPVEAAETAIEAVEDQAETSPGAVIGSDSRSVALAPGEAVEIKLSMQEGALVVYQWTSGEVPVNFDVHGDNESIDYYNYSKALNVTGDSGVLEAEFDGNHGWFWRNRSEETAEIELKVQGNYSAIKEM